MNCPTCNLILHKCAIEGADIDLNQVMTIGDAWPKKIICTKRQKYICLNPTCGGLEIITNEVKEYTIYESQK